MYVAYLAEGFTAVGYDKNLHDRLGIGEYPSDCLWIVPGTVDPLED